MDDGASDSETAELLEGFVEDVAGIEVRSDEDVGAALQRAVWGFLAGDGGINGGVELYFAVDKIVGVMLANLIKTVLVFVKVGVLAAGAVSGIGKEGDTRLLLVICFESVGGVFDYGV